MEDSERTPLYLPGELSTLFGCSTNLLSMYLSRRKKVRDSGIFQATAILYKSVCRKDVKVGGYFISLKACLDFQVYWLNRTNGTNIPGSADSSAKVVAPAGDDSNSNALLGPLDLHLDGFL